MSARKLYRVDVSFEMYILAESEEEADKIAFDHADDELSCGDVDFCVSLEKGPVSKSVAFIKPWGVVDDDDERSVAQILAEQAKESAAAKSGAA